MYYSNPLASKNSLINGLRIFFCVLLVNLWRRRQCLQKNFLLLNGFFLIRRKNYVFRSFDRKSDRGSLSYSKLPTNKLIISIWSNFLENINSIEQLLSKIQPVERKCELGFDAHFHRMPLFTEKMAYLLLVYYTNI